MPVGKVHMLCIAEKQEMPTIHALESGNNLRLLELFCSGSFSPICSMHVTNKDTTSSKRIYACI
jgi:hypothetical protein